MRPTENLARESMTKAAVILAAGQGTRMKSAVPKVLHKVAGLPMLGHVIAAVRGAGVDRIAVVTSPDGQEVRNYATGQACLTAVQEKQLGTGHAVSAAWTALEDFRGELVIAYGDNPLMTPATFQASFAAAARTGMGLAVFRPDDAGAYGRVILGADGLLDRIVEFKDAGPDERAAPLCNAGVLAADAGKLFRWAAKLKNDNAQKEYYLTDVPLLAKAEGVRCTVAVVAATEALGVNSRAELAQAEFHMQQRLRARALAAGVGMTAPETVFLTHDTRFEADVEIEPFVVFGPGVTVRSGARVRSHCHLEGAEVAGGAVVGPYARLRPGTKIGEEAHIGNVVEVKNTAIGKGAKANHLTYLGDAAVGPGANIGAGTITCNYDGFTKARTEIGAGAFIGSDTALVAPVTVGEGAITAAGSVITGNVAADALAVARGRQTEIPGWAKRFRERKKAERK
jgi:bifunctional UDP-N-acetylglucosamine pyrophosphorylase/glucosamine-1-phosphate N-acetyltransferase